PLITHLQPRRTSTPLFPYTTLFRSKRHRLADVRRNDPAALRNRAARLLFPCATRDPRRSHASSTARISETKHLAEVPSVVILVQDRKSTRLNSSHLVTSYAVFCLKK